MSPLRFRPIVKRARWGGTRLQSLFGKSLGSEHDYAESWEFSDHGADQSVVDGGPSDGLTLRELMHGQNRALLGRHAGLKQFPLLVKFLDAHDRLSLQVHPNDVQARLYQPGENGKTEAWVVIDAEPGARVFAGLKRYVDSYELLDALRNGHIDECLHSFEVQAGDCIFIPAGTVHAIGEGIVLAEVQQSSDLTFRLWDWGRVGADGQPRELHVDEAVICIDFERGPVDRVEPRSLVSCFEGPGRHYETEELVACDYFVLHRHRATTPFRLIEQNCCHALLALSGCGRVEADDGILPFERGGSVLIPAASTDSVIVPDGELLLLDAFLPPNCPWIPTDLEDVVHAPEEEQLV